MKQDMIVILDLGSTENTVIARDIRSLGVYSEIHPHDITPDELKALDNVKGIILNGGENRIVDGKPVVIRPELYDLGYPMISVDYPESQCDVKFDKLPDQDTLKKFVFETCKAEPNWNMKNFIEDQVELIRRQVGDKKVLLALSGGVDSSVVAALLIKAIGQQLVCVHVNHGLMRKNESESVVQVFRDQLHANLVYVDASERFLGKLENVADPEEKRKIIGGEFIRVFEEEARKLEGIEFLGQGTIYPDIIESGTKTAKCVKSHHNVGGLPEDPFYDGLKKPFCTLTEWPWPDDFTKKIIPSVDNAKVVVFCKHPHAPEIRFFLPGVFICGNEPSPFREPGNEKISVKRLAVTAVTCNTVNSASTFL